jgi:hypothetical protein
MSRTSTLSGSSLAQPIPLAAAAPRFLTGFKHAPNGNGCAWNAVSAFANCGRAVAFFRGSYVPILLQKSAITMREDCLDLLTRLPTMPLLASGSAPTRDLAPLWFRQGMHRALVAVERPILRGGVSFARLRRG